MSSPLPDLEKGPESTNQAVTPNEAEFEKEQRPEILREHISMDKSGPIPALQQFPTSMLSSNATVNLFRTHLGIYNLPELELSDARPAANEGIYKRVIRAEKDASRQYKIYASLINGALGLQIILAAALTALGAGNGPHTAVTAFGAINTVLAGLLTFLKGSGLPNRLKFYQNEWTKVREYIEQRERDFATNDYRFLHLDLLEEIGIIERMYENVRKDIEANTPDSYISLNHSTKGTDPPPSLARHLQNIDPRKNAQFAALESNARERFAGLQNGLTGAHNKFAGVQQGFDGAHAQIIGAGQDLEKRVIDTQHIAQQGIVETQQQAQLRMRETQKSVQDRIAETQQQAANRAKDIEEKVMMAAEKAAEKVLSLTRHRHEGHN